MRGDARFPADIRDCPVAIVVKQPPRPRLEDARNTRMMRAVLVDAAPARLVELRKLANEKVQPPIVVVIEPHRARTPSWSRDAGLLRHIRESPVTIIMIEDAASVLRHVQIGKAVAIIIPRRYSHSVAATGDARLFRHICERAVAIVPIKRIAQRLRRTIEITLAAIHQINVHPAVVIVIKKRAARPARLRQIFLRGLPCCVKPADPALRRRYLFKGIRRRRRSCPQKRKHPWTKRPRKQRHALEKSAPRKKKRLTMGRSIKHPRHYAQNHITLQKRSPILTTFEWKPRCPVRGTQQTVNPLLVRRQIPNDRFRIPE